MSVNCGIVYVYMFYDNFYLSVVLYSDKLMVMDGYFVILFLEKMVDGCLLYMSFVGMYLLVEVVGFKNCSDVYFNMIIIFVNELGRGIF